MRELDKDDGISVGAAADVLVQAYELRDRADALAKEIGRMFVAHERNQATSAEGFRAHTKSAPRFPAPEPYAIAAESHGCAIPDELAEKIDRCGE